MERRDRPITTGGKTEVIRVILLSNKPIVLAGLRNALKVDADIQVVAESKTVADMLHLVETHQPDIVVMDAVLPDADFLNVIRDMLAKSNPPEILIFSLDGRTEVILKAFQTGVRGYLLYCEDFSLVVEAVRTIAAGGRSADAVARRR